MKSESVLNIECSMYENAKTTTPRKINLLKWLKSNQYLSKQEKVRCAITAEAKRVAKEAMPCITASGVFSKRGKNYLLQHTGLIAIDIDMKENNQIDNYHDLKNELSKLQNVAYCGLSVSGKGYWLLIPIAHPEKHEFHFEYIRQYFQSKNIIIDKACKDIARLRFYSYDINAYFNHNAKPVETYYEPAIIKPKQSCRSISELRGTSSWKEYNNTKHFINVLENHGWKISHKIEAKIYFTRPDKISGVSAEYDGNRNVFYVFTENGYPFESSKGYSPFQIYTILDHAGDFSNAARGLMLL
jgi:hypothetical protein